MISEEYYNIPKKTIRASGKIDHSFQPNSFRVVQNLYQDKASMDMTLKEIKLLTSTCWDNKINHSVLIWQKINLPAVIDKD